MSFDFNNIKNSEEYINDILDIKKISVCIDMTIVPLDIPENGHQEIQHTLLDYFDNPIDNHKYNVNGYYICDPAYNMPSKFHNIKISTEIYCKTYYEIISHIFVFMTIFGQYAYDNKLSLTWHSVNITQDKVSTFDDVIIGNWQANEIAASKVILIDFNIKNLILLKDIPYIPQIFSNCTATNVYHNNIKILSNSIFNTYKLGFLNTPNYIEDDNFLKNTQDFNF